MHKLIFVSTIPFDKRDEISIEIMKSKIRKLHTNIVNAARTGATGTT